MSLETTRKTLEAYAAALVGGGDYARFFTDETGAAAEADFIGTHTGEFAGIPSTHRQVEVPYSVLYDLKGEKISALRIYMPMHLLFEQLGVPAGNPCSRVVSCRTAARRSATRRSTSTPE